MISVAPLLGSYHHGGRAGNRLGQAGATAYYLGLLML